MQHMRRLKRRAGHVVSMYFFRVCFRFCFRNFFLFRGSYVFPV